MIFSLIKTLFKKIITSSFFLPLGGGVFFQRLIGALPRAPARAFALCKPIQNKEDHFAIPAPHKSNKSLRIVLNSNFMS